MQNPAKPILLFVDADACPVKSEIYRVAERYGLEVYIVSNNFIAIPRNPRIKRVLVGDGFDAADDWIAERAVAGDIVITNDIPLAARCIANAAVVIAPNGRLFTEASIGMALATRNLMQDLRAGGAVMGGPRPFLPRDRSAFLSALDLAIVRLRQKGYG